MRLDHLLSKEEEVKVLYTVEFLRISSQLRRSEAFGGAIDENLETTFLVAMRLGDTPVPIPNTMVKT